MSDRPTFSYRFAAAHDGLIDLSQDHRLALMAVCVASQRAAGFRDWIDIREAKCPDCNAPGFNTGWGVWRFTCDAEIHASGEPAEPCQRALSPTTPEATDEPR